jgi:hypothetical protein
MIEKAKRFSDNFIADYKRNEAAKQIDGQIRFYADKIDEYSSEVRVLRTELELVEGELYFFLEDYYTKISQYVLDIMQTSKQDAEVKEFAENIYLLNRKKFEAKDIELKKIYKRLVKIFHPDSLELGDVPDKEELFKEVQALYLQRNYSGLVEILNAFDGGSEDARAQESTENKIQRLEKLEKKYLSYSKERNELDAKLQNVLASKEYKLFERVKWGKLVGKNVFDDIIYHIQKNN